MIKLAISPINWSNDDDHSLGGDIPLEQCLAEMSEAGYEGTELGHKYPTTPNELQSVLSKHQLCISSAWFSTFFTQENGKAITLSNFLQKLSFLKSVGADVINVCECAHGIQQQNLPLFSEKKPKLTPCQWKNLIEGLHEMGRIAIDHDMKLSYHYHLGTAVQTWEEVLYLMDHTSPELLGLLLDTGHAMTAGIEPLHLLNQYGPRINQVHLKDVREEILAVTKRDESSFMTAIKKGLFTVPGDGMLDWPPIFKQLHALEYQGWWVIEAEQDPTLAPPFNYAKMAMSFVRPYLDKEFIC